MSKTILITGGAGYIGSQFIRDLAKDPQFAGYTIRIYDNLQRQRYSGLMDLPSQGLYEFVEGDVLDRLNLQRAMQNTDIVVHLAAIVRTPLSFEHPEWTEQVNHWGTATVVECAVNAGVKRLIYSSSASVYGSGGPFQETDKCRPVGPYPTAKHHGELSVLHGGDRGLEATVIRFGTVFGNAPAMRFDAFASRAVYLAGVGRPIVLHGSGEQKRPLIHIRDASAVLRFCLTHPSTIYQILNAATANPTANEIADLLKRLVPTATSRYTDQAVLSEVSFEIDSSKLSKLGFEPQYGVEQGILEMLQRWQSFHSVEPNEW